MTVFEILVEQGISKEFADIHSWLKLLNADTVKFDDQYRFEILPLRRKERRGLEWREMRATLFIRKTPNLKFDVADGGGPEGELHWFESESVKETHDWLVQLVKDFQK